MQPKSLQDFIRLVQDTHFTLHLINLYLLRVPVLFDQHGEFIAMMEDLAAGVGIVEALRMVPYDLRTYKLRLPFDVCERHNVNVRNIWERINGKPREELQDVVLELAALARRYLTEASKKSQAMPKRAHLALLQAVPAEHYLERLEKYDFNVFAPKMVRQSQLVVPLRMLRAARNNTCLLYL